MIFDKSKYLTNDEGLIFKAINTEKTDQIISNLRIMNETNDSNQYNYNINKIDVNDIKTKFLVIKTPPLKNYKVKFESYAIESFDKTITIDSLDLTNILKNDIPNIANGIRNRTYFLTNEKYWTKIDKVEVNQRIIEIEINKKD